MTKNASTHSCDEADTRSPSRDMYYFCAVLIEVKAALLIMSFYMSMSNICKPIYRTFSVGIHRDGHWYMHIHGGLRALRRMGHNEKSCAKLHDLLALLSIG